MTRHIILKCSYTYKYIVFKNKNQPYLLLGQYQLVLGQILLNFRQTYT